MSKKSTIPQSRRHVWIYDPDWEWLAKRYGATLGPGTTVRRIVHAWVERMKAAERAVEEQRIERMKDDLGKGR